MSDQSSKTLESMSQAVWYNRWTLGKFAKFLSGQILEIGCGIGNFTKFLERYGEVKAIDVNNDYIKQATKLLNGKVQIGRGDIEKGQYFFKDIKFNTVVCINVLEHVKNDLQAIRNIYKLLKPGGTLILLVPAHAFLFSVIDQSIGHFRRYEKEELINILLQNGFEIKKISKLNLIGAIGWYISGKLFKKNEVNESKIAIFNLISPFFLLLENISEPPIGTSILVIAQKGRK